MAALGLHCCARAFSSCGEWGLLFVAVRRLLIAVASLVVEHGLQARRLQQLWHVGSVVVARGLQSTGSVVVVHELSCSTTCGIFADQGSNPCALHWQVDSQPLRHQGSPGQAFLNLTAELFTYHCYISSHQLCRLCQAVRINLSASDDQYVNHPSKLVPLLSLVSMPILF